MAEVLHSSSADDFKLPTPSTTPDRLAIVLSHLWTNLKLAERRYTDAAAEALLAHATGVYRLGDAAGSTPHIVIIKAARHLIGEWWNAADMSDYTAWLCGECVEPDCRRLAEAALADANLRVVPYSNDDLGDLLAAAEQVTGRAIGTTIVKDELRDLLEAVGEVATRMRMMFLAGALRPAEPATAAATEPAAELAAEPDGVVPNRGIRLGGKLISGFTYRELVVMAYIFEMMNSEQSQSITRQAMLDWSFEKGYGNFKDLQKSINRKLKPFGWRLEALGHSLSLTFKRVADGC